MSRMSEPEREGIPDYADDASPERGQVPDPQEPALPGDQPQAVFEHGTTVDEQLEGERLDRRLAREEPDVGAGDVSPGDRGDREGDGEVLVAPDEGAHTDDEKEEVARRTGEASGQPEEQALRVEPE